MSTRGSFVLRLIGVLLLVGMLVGAGVMVYRYGYTAGLADAPEIALAISKAAEGGQPLPLPPAFGYGSSYAHPYRWMRPHYGFIPFGGVVGFILMALLFFGLLRLIFFRRWAWSYRHPHGPDSWKRYGPWGPPPWEREEAKGKAEAEPDPEG